MAIFLCGILFTRMPRTLRALWDRGVIGTPFTPETQTGQAFSQFINEFNAQLNSRKAWLVAVLFALIGLLGTFKVRAWIQYCAVPSKVDEIVRFCTDQFG
jgi:hypothetical protein